MNINGTLNDLCKSNQIRNLIKTELIKLGKEAGLMTYEQIRNIHLHPELFTIDKKMLLKIYMLKYRQANLNFNSNYSKKINI